MAGTIELLANAPSSVSLYFFETRASVMTTGSLGSATRNTGGVMVEGNCRCADCTAFSTLAMFSVSVDCSENVAVMLTWPL